MVTETRVASQGVLPGLKKQRWANCLERCPAPSTLFTDGEMVVVFVSSLLLFKRNLMIFLWPIGITKPPRKRACRKGWEFRNEKNSKMYCRSLLLFFFFFGLRHSELAFNFSQQQYKSLIFWCWLPHDRPKSEAEEPRLPWEAPEPSLQSWRYC